jgi:hypothetical protein
MQESIEAPISPTHFFTFGRKLFDNSSVQGKPVLISYVAYFCPHQNRLVQTREISNRACLADPDKCERV